ncbi:unnamed protein product, partial [Effrenium voratum]
HGKFFRGGERLQLERHHQCLRQGLGVVQGAGPLRADAGEAGGAQHGHLRRSHQRLRQGQPLGASGGLAVGDPAAEGAGCAQLQRRHRRLREGLAVAEGPGPLRVHAAHAAQAQFVQLR